MRYRPLFALLTLPLVSCAEAPASSAAPITTPPGVYAMARGAGVVTEGTDSLQFSFIVKNQGLPGGVSCSGTIDGTQVKFQGPAKAVAIGEHQVSFEGAGTMNGQPVNFKAVGLDGDKDQLTVTFDMTTAHFDINGPLSNGQVEIEMMPTE